MALEPAVDLASLPPMLQRALAPASPPALAMGLAKGAVPGLRPEQLLLGVLLIARGDFEHFSPEVRSTAESTLQKPAAQLLSAALSSKDIHPALLDVLADTLPADRESLEKVLTHGSIASTTLARVAKICDESTSELVATNEQRLLQNPAIIEALYMNKRTRMSTADRLLDLAVRNGVELHLPAFREAAEAIAQQVISPPSVHPTELDLLAREIQAEAEKIEAEVSAAHELVTEDEQGQVVLDKKVMSLENKLAQLNISGKIRQAMLGTSPERAILVRNTNRLIAQAVIKSPLLNDNEAATYSANRALSADVLREIGANGRLVRFGTVRFNLVRNPKTPLATAQKLLPQLREDELKKLDRDKTVSGQVKTFVRQMLSRKKP